MAETRPLETSEVRKPAERKKYTQQELDQSKHDALTEIQDFFGLSDQVMNIGEETPVSMCSVSELRELVIDLLDIDETASQVILENAEFAKSYGIDLPKLDKKLIANQFVNIIQSKYQDVGAIWFHEVKAMNWGRKIVRQFLGKRILSKNGEVFILDHSDIELLYSMRHEYLHAVSQVPGEGTGFHEFSLPATRSVNEAVTDLLNIAIELKTKDFSKILEFVKNESIRTSYERDVKSLVTILLLLQSRLKESFNLDIDQIASLYILPDASPGDREILFEMELGKLVSLLPEFKVGMETVLSKMGINLGK